MQFFKFPGRPSYTLFGVFIYTVEKTYTISDNSYTVENIFSVQEIHMRAAQGFCVTKG